MHPILNIAILAARKAGDLMAKCYETKEIINTNPQKKTNFFYNYAERLIIDIIYKFYPSHTIISNSTIKKFNKNNDVQWIITPGGGINLIKCFPHFAVSIAVRIKERTEVAVIYDPIRNELFSTMRGNGTQLNGYRFRGSMAKKLNGTILATSFVSFKKKIILKNIIIFIY